MSPRDASRPGGRGVRDWPRRGLTVLVRGYRFFLSPWLGSACRFWPTCSAYSLQALDTHGAAAGTYLTLARLARCHPWCDGGHDPVPERFDPWWRRLLRRRVARGGRFAGRLSPPSSSTSPKKTLP